MTRIGLWRGTCCFSALKDFVESDVVVLNILSLDEEVGVKAQLTGPVYEKGLAGLGKKSGNDTWNLVGSMDRESGKIRLNKAENPAIVLELEALNPEGLLTGKIFFGSGDGADLELRRM